jgi:hypothetical protein
LLLKDSDSLRSIHSLIVDGIDVAISMGKRKQFTHRGRLSLHIDG